MEAIETRRRAVAGPRPGEVAAIGEDRVGRRALEEILATPGAGVRILARSDRVLRHLDLLREIGASGGVAVEVALATLDAGLARRLEPGAPPPRRRLSLLRALARGGIVTGLRIDPVVPCLTDGLGDLRRLLRAAASAGALAARARVLRLREEVRRPFLDFLRREHPALVGRYLRRYRDGPAPPPEYERRVLRVVDALRREIGLAPGPPPVSPSAQRRLPFGGLAPDSGYAVASGAGTAAPLERTG